MAAYKVLVMSGNRIDMAACKVLVMSGNRIDKTAQKSIVLSGNRINLAASQVIITGTRTVETGFAWSPEDGTMESLRSKSQLGFECRCGVRRAWS
ncbi:unnamed protein product [Sphagnum balticum]